MFWVIAFVVVYLIPLAIPTIVSAMHFIAGLRRNGPAQTERQYRRNLQPATA
jgi:ABC-type Fe3+ transport system permease subunit